MIVRAATSWMSVRLAVGSALTLGTTVVVASHLTGAEWAPFSAAVMIMQASSDLLFRGYAALVITSPRPLSREQIGGLATRQLRIVGCLWLITAALAAFLSSRFGDPVFTFLLMATVPSQLAFALRSTGMAMLERGMRFREVALIELTETAVFCSAAVLLIWFTGDVRWLAVPLVVRGAISLVLVHWRLGDEHVWPTLRSNPKAGAFVQGGGAFIAISSLGLAYGMIPPVLFALAEAQEELGTYQFAVTTYTYILVFAQAAIRVGFVRYAATVRHRWDDFLPAAVPMTAASVAAVAGLVLVCGEVGGYLPPSVMRTGVSQVYLLAPAYVVVASVWTTLAPMAMSRERTGRVCLSLGLGLGAYVVTGAIGLSTPVDATVAVAASFTAATLVQVTSLVWLVWGTLPGSEVLAPAAVALVSGLVIWTFRESALLLASVVFAGLWAALVCLWPRHGSKEGRRELDEAV